MWTLITVLGVLVLCTLLSIAVVLCVAALSLDPKPRLTVRGKEVLLVYGLTPTRGRSVISNANHTDEGRMGKE
jgi:hypothetical protein